MKKLEAAALHSALALVVASCSQQTAERSPEMREEVWQARNDILVQLGLATTLSQDRSRVVVRVSNMSQTPVCITSLSWPSNAVGLDHFKVSDADGLVEYQGALYSVIGDEVLMLQPGQTWTLSLDLSPYYGTDWQKAQVNSFWAPFYECEAT